MVEETNRQSGDHDVNVSHVPESRDTRGLTELARENDLLKTEIRRLQQERNVLREVAAHLATQACKEHCQRAVDRLAP